MRFPHSYLVQAALVALAASSSVRASPATKRAESSTAFFNPYNNGGSMLTGGTASGLGEPVNVIVSGLSDPGVLSQAGFEEFSRAFYFSPGSCLGITQGTAQTLNLGDGNGAESQTNLMRWNFKQGDGGTCLESLNGGNHFRYWIQNGTSADSGAIFIAASVELNATLNHTIAPNGYNRGRNEMVGNATAGTLTSPGGFKYTVSSTTNSQLLSSVTTSQINHDISIDGDVSILTVKITKNGTIGATSTATSSASSGTSVSSGNGSSTSASTTTAVNFASILATMLLGSAIVLVTV